MSNHAFSLTDLERILTRAAGLPAGAGAANEDKTLADAGLDSLAFLQLQTELADGYGVELPDGWHSAHTLAEIVDFANDQMTMEEAA